MVVLPELVDKLATAILYFLHQLAGGIVKAFPPTEKTNKPFFVTSIVVRVVLSVRYAEKYRPADPGLMLTSLLGRGILQATTHVLGVSNDQTVKLICDLPPFVSHGIRRKLPTGDVVILEVAMSDLTHVQ